MGTLNQLLKQVQQLVVEGHGECPVYISDGNSCMDYRWDGYANQQEVDENADGELFELEEGTPYISIGFG